MLWLLCSDFDFPNRYTVNQSDAFYGLYTVPAKLCCLLEKYRFSEEFVFLHPSKIPDGKTEKILIWFELRLAPSLSRMGFDRVYPVYYEISFSKPIRERLGASLVRTTMQSLQAFSKITDAKNKDDLYWTSREIVLELRSRLTLPHLFSMILLAELVRQLT